MADTKKPQSFLERFSSPPREAAPVPFWMWNGDLDPDELRRQIGLMAGAGVHQFVIHPREGLTIPYLSDKWFHRVGVALDEAKRRGMGVWIYDDLNWPSGYAGGRVLGTDPSKQARHLARVSLDCGKAAKGNSGRGSSIDGETGAEATIEYGLAPMEQLAAAFAVGMDGSVGRIEPDGSDRGDSPSGPGLKKSTVSVEAETPHLRFNLPPRAVTLDLYLCRPTSFAITYRPDLRYVDLLDPDAVNLFIECTHEEYWRRFEEYFGTTIRGFFTDEPGFYNNLFGCDPETFPWTPGFPEHFKRLRGYDLLPVIGALWQPAEGAAETPAKGPAARSPAAVRRDYFDALAELYRESWFSRLHHWCRERKVQLTGHLLCEEDLVFTARSQGDFFRHFRHLDLAGVDLVHRLGEEKSAGVRLGASAARHLGDGRLASETFGMFGWELTLADMRYALDWQAVRGLTALIPHAFYYSTDGERKRECPPSLFFQNVWWRQYPVFQQYAARLLGALSSGRSEASVAVCYPLETVWTLLDPTPEGEARAREVDILFRGLVLALEAAQIDFHILDGGMIEAAEVTDDGALALNDCLYRALLLPAMELLPGKTANHLSEFTDRGGYLAAIGGRPDLPADPESAGAGVEEVAATGRGNVEFYPVGSPGVMGLDGRPLPWKTLHRLRGIAARRAPRLEQLGTRVFRRLFDGAQERASRRVASARSLDHLIDQLKTRVRPDFTLDSPAADIRHHRIVLRPPLEGSLDMVLNQGDEHKQITARLAGPGIPHLLDPETGTAHPVRNHQVELDGVVRLSLDLPPKTSRLIYLSSKPAVGSGPADGQVASDGAQAIQAKPGPVEAISAVPQFTAPEPAKGNSKVPPSPCAFFAGALESAETSGLSEDAHALHHTIQLDCGWEGRIVHSGEASGAETDEEGGSPVLSGLGDWCRAGLQKYSGTVKYETIFSFDPAVLGEKKLDDCVVTLDLGDVRETARVILNGRTVGDLPWPPYRLRVERLIIPGENCLAIEVTNTLANRFEGRSRVSGLLGPVSIRFNAFDIS